MLRAERELYPSRRRFGQRVHDILGHQGTWLWWSGTVQLPCVSV